MLSQNERDSGYAADHSDRSSIHVQASQYRVMVSRQLLDEHSNLLDRVIEFAFETLGARRLQQRVYDEM